ncbi:unnamed protein product [Cochlearia groenlandica]
MDATMYLFREKISLGLLNFPRVGFMDCLFGMNLQVEFKRFLGNKQNHKWNGGKVSLSPYTIVHTPVPLGLNKSQGDCGVYALKYIECHMLDLPLKMLEDENIKCARHKIVFDLLEAAFDPVFIEQMTMFEPPPRDSEIVEIN